MTSPVDRKSWWHFLPLLVWLIILVFDQVTKTLIRANLSLGESIPADGRFRLTYVNNSGGIFGLSMNSTFLTIMGIIVVLLISWLYFRKLSIKSSLMQVGLGMVLGGAVGNLIDRIRFGAVTDFLDVRLWGDYHWATFNVADASISIGITILVFSILSSMHILIPDGK